MNRVVSNNICTQAFIYASHTFHVKTSHKLKRVINYTFHKLHVYKILFAVQKEDAKTKRRYIAKTTFATFFNLILLLFCF